jgi:transposase
MSKNQQRSRQTDSDPNLLSQINHNAAGIDIGADRHWVSVPVGRDEKNVRSFACFTSDLYAMADWLQHCGVDTVAMESTGVYWIPVFQVLESRGLEVKLVNAHHVKTVPGRKTDVLDCQWLQQLHTYGLLSGYQSCCHCFSDGCTNSVSQSFGFGCLLSSNAVPDGRTKSHHRYCS